MNLNKGLLVLTLFTVSGCSDSVDKATNEPPPKDGHFFDTQTDALDKVKQAEKMIMDAAAQQQRDIEEQSQ